MAILSFKKVPLNFWVKEKKLVLYVGIEQDKKTVLVNLVLLSYAKNLIRSEAKVSSYLTST